MELHNGAYCYITHRTVGPRHDPYDCQTISIDRGDMSCEWEANSLGSDHVIIKKGDEVVFERKWFDAFGPEGKKKNIANRVISTIMIRRAVGITPDEAEAEYHSRYRPDPFGPASRYE